MARNYTREQIIQMVREAYSDVDGIISEYVSAALRKDDFRVQDCKERALNILTPIEQIFSVVIEHLEEE